MKPSQPAKLYLLPAGLIIASGPSEISTILGSCVAVAIGDPNCGIAGMTHYLLPNLVGQGELSPRYGSIGIPSLVTKLLGQGARRERLVSRIYGGGEVLKDVQIGEGVGRANVAYAFACLKDLGIPVISSHTGGTHPRRVILMTETFEVRHALLANAPLRKAA